MKTTAYKNQYNSSHYDRIQLVVPKGEKDRLKRLAASQGISLNEYICRVIRSQENDMLDRMQIAEKYRIMINCITGSTKEGYTIHLNKGYIYSETGEDSFWRAAKVDRRVAACSCVVGFNSIQRGSCR